MRDTNKQIHSSSVDRSSRKDDGTASFNAAPSTWSSGHTQSLSTTTTTSQIIQPSLYRDFFLTDKSTVIDELKLPKAKRSGPRGGVINPFPVNVYTMLQQTDSEGSSDIVGWQMHGRCFALRKPDAFARDIMPQFFRQTKLSSFQRQMNLWGFEKIANGSDQGCYYHPLFLRGRPDLAKIMYRVLARRTSKTDRVDPDFDRYPSCTETKGHDVIQWHAKNNKNGHDQLEENVLSEDFNNATSWTASPNRKNKVDKEGEEEEDHGLDSIFDDEDEQDDIDAFAPLRQFPPELTSSLNSSANTSGSQWVCRKNPTPWHMEQHARRNSLRLQNASAEFSMSKQTTAAPSPAGLSAPSLNQALGGSHGTSFPIAGMSSLPFPNSRQSSIRGLVPRDATLWNNEDIPQDTQGWVTPDFGGRTFAPVDHYNW